MDTGPRIPLNTRPRTPSKTLESHGVSKANRKRKRDLHCPICDLSFKQQGFLARHMDLHSATLLSSDRCEGGATESTQRSAQAGKNARFSCETCGKDFIQKINLTNHMRVHTGERPFCCTECDAAFKQQSALDNHMRRHSGETPYACWECDAKFRQRSHLDNHRRRHNGERPYSCDQCDASFIQRSNLNSHMSKHRANLATFKRKGSKENRGRKLFVLERCQKVRAGNTHFSLTGGCVPAENVTPPTSLHNEPS